MWDYISIRTEQPSLSGGGTSLSDRERIAELENRLEQLESRLATAETPGLVRLSSSEAVTDSNGLALPASEKNAALEGTLANQLKNISQKTGNLEYIKVPGQSYSSNVDLCSKVSAFVDGKQDGIYFVNGAWPSVTEFSGIIGKVGNIALGIIIRNSNAFHVLRGCAEQTVAVKNITMENL